MRWIGTSAIAALLAGTTIARAQPTGQLPAEPAAEPPAPAPEPPPPPEPPPQPPAAQPQPQPPAYPYPYPYQYPPPGYPPPGYPPPGYAPAPGYPPPPGYYGYAPTPAPRPKPRYPADSSVQTSPFIDVIAGGTNMERRFTHFLAFGVQGGAYLGGLVRVAPQISMFTSEPEDDYGLDDFDGTEDLPDGFRAQQSDSPAILWGGSVGFALLARQTFVFAPGVLFLRTDESAYGSFLGLHAPFEWVTDDGARIGFVVAFGRAFGGSVRGECFDSGFGGPVPCDPGEVREFDREAGAAFYSQFQIGWGFNHPKPIPPPEQP